MGFARDSDLLEVFGFDVFPVDFLSDFPSSDVIGSELLAFVVSVIGGDPAALGSRCLHGGRGLSGEGDHIRLEYLSFYYLADVCLAILGARRRHARDKRRRARAALIVKRSQRSTGMRLQCDRLSVARSAAEALDNPPP